MSDTADPSPATDPADEELETRWAVGVDGSPDAASALRWAAMMAADSASVVVPVCAWHVPLPMFALAGRRGIDVDRMGIQATAEVAAADTIAATVDTLGAADAADAGIDELVVVEGDPASVLLDRSTSGDVVVVGRRGISEFRHRVLGSVSRDLATHASGPVVVVPEGWASGPCRRIVVGFDGSDHAQAALRWALRIAPADATVTALMAIDVIPWLQPELVVERHPDYVEAAEHRIRATVDEVDPTGRAERSVVLHGPRQALAEAVSDADLVVLGPRGLGGVGRTLLGSVTTWMLHDAPCPVAVVPS